MVYHHIILIIISKVVLMLGQRRRQWANIKTTSVQRLVSAGMDLNQQAKTANH